MSFPVEQIRKLSISYKAQKFRGSHFRDLMLPGVYVLVKNDLATYIGYSNCLLHRVASPRHHRLQAERDCDELLLYPCRNEKDAQELEQILIRHLRPKLNHRGKASLRATPAECASALKEQTILDSFVPEPAVDLGEKWANFIRERIVATKLPCSNLVLTVR